MNANELKSTLQSLRTALAANTQIDVETVALLQLLDRDIHATLGEGEGDVHAPADLSERAQMLAARFAAEHPQLEASLRAVAEALGKMGI